MRLKGKHITITNENWTSKKIENYAVLTAHCIEGGKFKSCVLHFEHHRGRNREEDIGREFSQIFDNYGFDLSYIFFCCHRYYRQHEYFWLLSTK